LPSTCRVKSSIYGVIPGLFRTATLPTAIGSSRSAGCSIKQYDYLVQPEFINGALDCGYWGGGVVSREALAVITINLNRGLKGMGEKLIARFPNGQAILDGGLREVMYRMIDEQGISREEFTAVSLAERLGFLQTEAKPRRRRKA
jgi:hypothetical protein